MPDSSRGLSVATPPDHRPVSSPPGRGGIWRNRAVEASEVHGGHSGIPTGCGKFSRRIRWCGQRPTTGYVLSSLRDKMQDTAARRRVFRNARHHRVDPQVQAIGNDRCPRSGGVRPPLPMPEDWIAIRVLHCFPCSRAIRRSSLLGPVD